MNKREVDENLFQIVKLFFLELMLTITSLISRTSDSMQIILGTL